MENKYNSAKIYKIVSNITGECYFGSTTEPILALRLARHRSSYKQYLNNKFKFITIRAVFFCGNDDFLIIKQ